METKLISITEIIRQGWKLYTENFQRFLIPILILLGPYIVFYFAQLIAGKAGALLFLGLTALLIFINIWIEIAITLIVNKIYLNQPIDTNNILEISFQKIPSLFLVSILVALITIGGLILLIIPGIILSIWYAFAQYINILEDKDNKGLAALISSKKLVSGRWWPVFWRVLLPGLFVFFFVILIVIALTFLITNGQYKPDSPEQNLLINAATTLIFLILTPLFASFNIIVYNNLKQKQPAEQSINL